MSTPIDQLLRDQLDFAARLNADPYFADIAVLLEAKGITEDDITQALSILNQKGGKIGACVIVLMPTLAPDTPDAPGPRGRLRLSVQVIEAPLFNAPATGGTGKAATALALRVRGLLHRFTTGLGSTFSFTAQEPVPVDEGRISYSIAFERPHQDTPEAPSATPMIEPEGGASPATATIQAEPGAAIYYTTDSTYPWSGNPAATLYTAPVSITTTATLRAVATLAGKRPSDVSEATFSA